jgi:alpha-tubulin suppressor-like RCC1 family protein
MAGFKYAIDRWGNELIKQATNPELVPVRDFKTQAQINALGTATPQPNDGTSYIVTDGTNKGNIATWDANRDGEAVGGWIYFVPSDLDVTTVTNPDNETFQGKWRYDLVGDYWVQITTGIELPEVIERPVSAENIAFGRVGNIYCNNVAGGGNFAYIQNDEVAMWGNNPVFTSGVVNSAEDARPRIIPFVWFNGSNTIYAPLGQYKPNFVDVVHNQFNMLAIDHLGKVWWAGNKMEGSGQTTTPTGNIAQTNIQTTGLAPINFWQSQTNVFASKIFINNARFDTTITTSAVLTTDNDLYLTGSNTQGQIGDGTLTTRNGWFKYPIPNIIDVKMADATVFALTADGKLYVTGYYDQANTLIASPFQQRTPRLMISDVASFDFLLDAGGFHPRTLMVVKTDGTVWGVGANAVGQIGDGTTTARNAFVRAIGVNNAKSVFVSKYAGSGLTGIIRTDGTVSFCGLNLEGVMGYSVATAQTNYTTFVTPAFPAQGTIIEGMIGRVCTLRTSTGAIWNAGLSSIRGLAHAVNNWTNNNKFQQVPLPEPALAMRGRMGQSFNSYEDGCIVLTANHGIIVWGSPFIGYASLSDQIVTYSPRRMADIRVLNNGITISDPLGGKYDAVATITAITAGSASDIYDEVSGQYVTISLTTDGTAGKLDTTDATLTGDDLSGIALQTSYVYHIGETANQIKLVFKLNASDALATGASATQNYTVTLGGISFNVSGNRIDDLIVKTLTTSKDLYLSANNLDPVVITQAEYDALAGLSGAVKSSATDAFFNGANSAGVINSTSFLTTVTNSASATNPALIAGYPIAFKFKGQAAGDSASYSTTQLGFATTPNGVGTALTNNVTLPAGTVMDSANTLYLVIKSPNVLTTAGSVARIKYPKGFTSNTGSPSFFVQGPSVNGTTTTTSNNANAAFGYQVLSLPTKLWI